MIITMNSSATNAVKRSVTFAYLGKHFNSYSVVKFNQFHERINRSLKKIDFNLKLIPLDIDNFILGVNNNHLELKYVVYPNWAGEINFSSPEVKLDELLTKQAQAYESGDTKVLASKLTPKSIDLILTRFTPLYNHNGMAVTQVAQQLGFNISNGIEGLRNCRDKFVAYQQILDLAPVVDSDYLRWSTNQIFYQDKHQGAVIFKPNSHSHGGNGISLAETTPQATQALYEEDVFNYGLLQEYIENPVTHDLRVMLVNYEVTGAFLRVRMTSEANEANNLVTDNNSEAKSTSIVSNISQGAYAVAYPIDKSLEEQAIAIAKRLKLDIAGLDFIYDQRTKQWRFLEANACPGFYAYDQALNQDFAYSLYNYATLRSTGFDLDYFIGVNESAGLDYDISVDLDINRLTPEQAKLAQLYANLMILRLFWEHIEFKTSEYLQDFLKAFAELVSKADQVFNQEGDLVEDAEDIKETAKFTPQLSSLTHPLARKIAQQFSQEELGGVATAEFIAMQRRQGWQSMLLREITNQFQMVFLTEVGKFAEYLDALLETIGYRIKQLDPTIQAQVKAQPWTCASLATTNLSLSLLSPPEKTKAKTSSKSTNSKSATNSSGTSSSSGVSSTASGSNSTEDLTEIAKQLAEKIYQRQRKNLGYYLGKFPLLADWSDYQQLHQQLVANRDLQSASPSKAPNLTNPSVWTSNDAQFYADIQTLLDKIVFPRWMAYAQSSSQTRYLAKSQPEDFKLVSRVFTALALQAISEDIQDITSIDGEFTANLAGQLRKLKIDFERVGVVREGWLTGIPLEQMINAFTQEVLGDQAHTVETDPLFLQLQQLLGLRKLPVKVNKNRIDSYMGYINQLVPGSNVCFIDSLRSLVREKQKLLEIFTHVFTGDYLTDAEKAELAVQHPVLEQLYRELSSASAFEKNQHELLNAEDLSAEEYSSTKTNKNTSKKTREKSSEKSNGKLSEKSSEKSSEKRESAGENNPSVSKLRIAAQVDYLYQLLSTDASMAQILEFLPHASLQALSALKEIFDAFDFSGDRFAGWYLQHPEIKEFFDTYQVRSFEGQVVWQGEELFAPPSILLQQQLLTNEPSSELADPNSISESDLPDYLYQAQSLKAQALKQAEHRLSNIENFNFNHPDWNGNLLVTHFPTPSGLGMGKNYRVLQSKLQLDIRLPEKLRSQLLKASKEVYRQTRIDRPIHLLRSEHNNFPIQSSASILLVEYLDQMSKHPGFKALIREYIKYVLDSEKFTEAEAKKIREYAIAQFNLDAKLL